MKINDDIIEILKNFSELNPSIIINEGNKLETISQSKAILAQSILPVVFDKKFAIYDLKRFIQTLKIFKTPELIFQDKYVTIKEDNKSVNYMYAEERTMSKNKVPDEKPDITDLQVEFDVSDSFFSEIEKIINILKLPNFVIEGDGENLTIRAENVKNPTSDMYYVTVGPTDKKFRAVFELTALGLLKDKYNVKICSSGVSKFVGQKVTYIIACDYKSKF